MEAGGNKIQVAESGNKRTNASEEDIRQAVNDIKNWFKENHAEYYENTLKEGKPSVGGKKEEVQQWISQFDGFKDNAGVSMALCVIFELCPKDF